MKKTVFFLFCLFQAYFSLGQSTARGRITDHATGTPVPNATITSAGGQYSISDDNGYFLLRLPVAGAVDVEISCIGFSTWKGHLHTGSVSETVNLDRVSSFMQPVEVRAVRASDKSPFTQALVGEAAIARQNLGQDLPFLLNQTPSVVVNSDAGNGVGYTGIRIRGTDATRINMTINGIPYNDAESQGIFFVNLPDLSSSLNSIQVQRGVGTSSNGTGAFGATMNLSTNELHEEAYGELNNSFGSFNTWKNTIKAGTGLLHDHFTVDARLSRISSDGYIDRASSNLQSFFVSGAYVSRKNSLRLNVFSGKEKTYQAWYGVPENLLEKDRTFNAAGTERPGSPYANETDNYRQTHYQLFYNQSLDAHWNLNLAGFYTLGKGYYEQYKASQSYSDYGRPDVVAGTDTIRETDLIRQLWLDNRFYGNIFSLQYKKPSTDLIIGGGWSRYEGHHFGEVIWAGAGFPDHYRWYDLDARKTDYNIYGKWQQKISQTLTVFTDLQLRNVTYNINGFRDNPGLSIRNDWTFFNPKLGISYIKKDWFAYLSYAVANKEPNREDFEAGQNQQPTYETLHDLEAGVEKRNPVLSWGAAIYYMQYRNQLVLTGQINDVGAYTRTNIPNSYRTGIELTARWKPLNWFDAAANLSLSENKIRDFTAYYDDYDAGGQKSESLARTDISYSPTVVGGATITFRPLARMDISFLSKYVSRQYLDNTARASRSLAPYFVQDLRLSYRVNPLFMKEITLVGQLNNVFNRHYEPNGYSFSYYYGGSLRTENYYYPMAGINYMLAVNMSF